ncbi:hypothetical protein ACHAPX_010396 [Trichoderma viride]|jgi:hypothetical protein
MRFLFFLSTSYLSAIVWAGGYAGCLERVMFFQAYEIDALLPSGQSIGYWCLKWDFQRKVCRNNQWKACEGDLEGNRCSFENFMSQINQNSPNPRQWPEYTSENKLDAKATALNCLKAYKATGRPIPDITPFKIMKGGTSDYRAAVQELGRRVDNRWKAFDAVAKEANKPAFTAFDATVDEIIRARRGDTGVLMYEAAKKTLEHDDNVTLKVEDLGTNPDPDETDPTKKEWKEVKWPETLSTAIEDGIPDAEKTVEGWVRSYIGNDPSSTPHRSMMKSFKGIVAGRKLCR